MPKSTPKCFSCGNEIKYIKVKGKNVAVSKVATNFIPSNAEDAVTFITPLGEVNKGVMTSQDAIRGHRLHVCQKR